MFWRSMSSGSMDSLSALSITTMDAYLQMALDTSATISAALGLPVTKLTIGYPICFTDDMIAALRTTVLFWTMAAALSVGISITTSRWPLSARIWVSSNASSTLFPLTHTGSFAFAKNAAISSALSLLTA